MTRLFPWAILLALCAPPMTAAQVTPVEEEAPLENADPQAAAERQQTPRTYRLTVAPAEEPNPPLKYRLLPDYWELQTGNAAPFYYRALLLQSQLPVETAEQYAENEDRWLADLSDPEVRKEAQAWVDQHSTVLEQLKTASYREDVGFDFGLRELSGTETIGFMLPEIQEMRQLARLLQIKARLEIEEGRFDDALQTLRMGCRMAQATSEPPFLVAGLVGIAIENVMSDVLLHFLAAPDAPNLYWALAHLPDPLIDLRPAMRQEMGLPHQLFPFLRDVETAQRSSDEWRRVIMEGMRSLNSLGGSGDGPLQGFDELAMLAMMMKAYPAAKRELIAAGYDRERIETMPVPQVIALQTARISDYAYQETFKWWGLPYWQTAEAVHGAEQKLMNEGVLRPQESLNRGALPLAGLLLPAIAQVRLAEVRGQRRLAMLQTVEAIRLAAARTGELPESLEGLTPPAPLNPATGKPFSYERRGETAVLEAPALAGHSPRESGLRYEITLRKSSR